MYILTKSDDGPSTLYAFPETLKDDASMKLEKITTLVFPALIRAGKRPHDNCMTTSAGFSPDASRMLVSTYSSLYEWTLPPEKSLAEALKAPPVRFAPLLVRQMEGACYDADSQTLWFSSEGLPTPLFRVTR